MSVGKKALLKLPTGIAGLDQIMLGGLPASRPTLLAGSAGSGKTVFALQFLAEGIRRFDEAGVFVTFEESPFALQHNAASLGFEIESWRDEGRWAFVDASPATSDEDVVVGDYDLSALVARIDHAVREIGARRVCLDSLGAVFGRFSAQGHECHLGVDRGASGRVRGHFRIWRRGVRGRQCPRPAKRSRKREAAAHSRGP